MPPLSRSRTPVIPAPAPSDGAIDQANGRPGIDRITFNIPGAGPHFIEPIHQLPDLTDTTDVDGATQPGYAGTPKIVVSGARVGSTIFYHPAGIIVRANDCVIRALCIQNFIGAGRVDHVNEGGIGLRIHGNRNVVVGPNHFQNAPVVEFATGLPNGRVRVEGFVRGEPGRTYRAEIFASIAPSAGAARGEIPAGTQAGIVTDASGTARFSIESSLIPARSWITATATRLDGRGPSPATSTMSDAILAPGSGRFAFAGGALVTPEGTGITVTLRRTGSSLGSASVRVIVDPETSNARPLDYLLSGLDSQGRIEFGPGVSERTLVLFPVRDGIDELATELVALRLTEPSPGATADNSLRLVGITDTDPNPTITVPSVSVFEGNTGITRMVFDVELSHASERLTSMLPVFDPGTTDLADTSGWLFSNVDDTHFRFEVFVLGDSAFEPDEVFQFHCVGGLIPNGVPGEDRIVSPTVTGTIRNDDAPPKQSVFFTAGSIVVTEGDGEVWASIQRSDSAGRAQVKILSESRTATRDRDFEVPNEVITVEFPEGHAGPIAFRVGLVDDLLDEDNESFVLRLENPSWSEGEIGVGDIGSFVVNMQDNDVEPGIEVTGVGSFEMPAGTTEMSIGLGLVDDLIDEEEEFVDVVLSAIAPTTLAGATSARVAVVDDDAPPIARLEDFVVVESDSPAEFPVRARVKLSQPSGRSIRLFGKLASGTALQDSDFVAELIEVNIPPGESSADVPLRFLADTDAEGVEFASFH